MLLTLARIRVTPETGRIVPKNVATALLAGIPAAGGTGTGRGGDGR